MKIKNLLFFSIFILNFISLNAFIVNVEALKNQLNDQHIIKLGDLHYGCSANEDYKHPTLTNNEIAEINKKQAREIVSFSKQYPAQDCLFIVEDLYNYTGKVKKIEINFYETRLDHEKNNLTNCMSYINDVCQQEHIDIANVEFRQSYILFFDTFEIDADLFLKEFQAAIKEIKEYNDSKELNNYYKQVISRIDKQNKKLLTSLRTSNKKYYNEIQNLISNTQVDQFCEDLCDLIDIKIIHNIYKHKNKKYIFVCAGDTHIQRINKLLTKINFHTIYKSPESSAIYPIDFKITLSKLVVADPEVESPYVFVFMLLMFFLSIKFPTRFRVLHFHSLKLISKMEKIS
ncbi:MAG: hypothetical protein P4L22_07230 [Candidatus Babeliales bacterium]|nr:hypothetical protein [Candidatus Babeliales bacterium]